MDAQCCSPLHRPPFSATDRGRAGVPRSGNRLERLAIDRGENPLTRSEARLSHRCRYSTDPKRTGTDQDKTNKMTGIIAEIHVTSPVDMEEQLDRAVALAQDQSIAGQRVGILVTRQGHRNFIVELHSAVAFGEIRERDARGHAPLPNSRCSIPVTWN